MIVNNYDAGGRKLRSKYFTLIDHVNIPVGGICPWSEYWDPEYGEWRDIVYTSTSYVGNHEYLESFDQIYDRRIHNVEGYALRTSHGDYQYHYYRRDHLGDNREVWRASYTSGSTTYPAATVQKTQYYPSGLPWKFNIGDNPGDQPYKFNGCEFIEMHGYDVTDLGNRGVHHATNRFTTMDRFCEKFPWQSPYVFAGNNPVNFIDVNGDSIMLTGENTQEIIMMIYNGLANGTSIKMKFNNGVLDPNSIAEQAQNSSDFFLQNMYEIAIHPKTIELSLSQSYSYKEDGKTQNESTWVTPYDYSDDDLGYETIAGLKATGMYTLGRTVQGNGGRTLFPQSKTGRISTNGNIQIIINSNGQLNHRTIALNHEFWHVISYLRGIPHYDGDPDFNKAVNILDTKMKRRLGYDY